MRIDGWTLFLQAINFLVLVWLVRRFLFQPVLAAVDRRNAEIARTRADAEASRTAAEAARRAVEAERSGMAAERERTVAEAHAAAVREGEAVRASARAEAARMRDAARLAVEEERRAALGELKGAALRLGTGIAGRLLAATADGTVARLFIDRAAADLAALPAHERVALAAQLGDGRAAGRVRVVTAAPLDEADRRHCAECLAGALGRPVETEFAEDPALVAGVELHFPHTVLRRSWRDALVQAEEALKRDADAR